MAKNVELEQLVINKLTQEQFDSIEEKNPAELYFVTDAEADGGKGAQVEEMPEATEMNAGQIVQYVGETIPDAEATATITQTVGDSLTDLKVDAEKFEKASGLTEAGSVEFYTTGSETKFVSDELPTNNNPGLTVKIDSDKFFDWLFKFYDIDINTISQVMIECAVKNDSSINNWGIDVYFDNDTSIILMEHLTELPEDSGISYEVAGLDNFNIWCRAYFEIAPKIAEWLVDNQVIDVNQYGITYSGTPSNGDTLKVDYTPFVGGYEKGYFYVNQVILSEPTVTIEQTIGTSLSDLSIDVDKFIEAEQPVTDCSVKFTAATENTHTTYMTQNGDVSFSGNISNLLKAKGWEQELSNGGVIVCGAYSDSVDDFYIGPEIGVNYLIISINELEEYGIHFDGIYSVGAYATWSYDESTDVFAINWTKDSNNVRLKQYGISYSGQPSTGDTITVNYITPQIKDYNWNQINVQPASKGNSGIEWVTKVDLPGDYVGSEYYAAPYYIIEGGLPDGTYEFYFSTKTTSESQLPLGEVIFKVLLTIDNENMQAFGKMGYVFDGNYMNDSNNMFSPDNINIWGFIKKNNSDIVLYSTDRPLSTSVLAYNGHQEVLGCFKLSKIENINTGEVYVATGYINIDGTTPKYESEYGGYIKLAGISAQPAIPQYHITYTGDFNSDTQYFTLHQSSAIACGRSACCSELDVSCSSSNGGKYHVIIENKTNSYVVYLKEASGDLENAQIGWNQYYSPYLFLNTKDEESGKITISVGAKGNDNSSSVHCYADIPYSFTPAVITRVGGEINEANNGMILQCQKDSTEEYTQGYFYKATGERALSPASIDIIWQNPENVTIEIDADKLVTALNSDFGWDIAWLQEILQGQHNYIYYNHETPHIYCSFYGDIYEESIVSCFKISNLDTLENDYVEFSTQNYQPEHIEIVNGKWEQVNVQPASNTVQVTEIPEASEENVGKILQYVGTPTSEYDQGYFYKCTADGWAQVNVQPASGGGGEAPSELPNLTGNEGRFLSNNGSELEWADIPTSLPAQEGHSGKYLTTDGENASWVEIELPESTDGVELPDQTGNSGKFLTTDGANLSWAEVSGGTSGFTKEEADALYAKINEEGGLVLSDTTLQDFAGDFRIYATGDTSTGIHITGHGAVYPENPNNQYTTLGRSDNKWIKTYTQTLNNGEDIQVPDKPGTLALIEDIEAVMGDLSSALDTINGEEI